VHHTRGSGACDACEDARQKARARAEGFALPLKMVADTTAIQAMQGQGLGEGGYYAVGMSQSAGPLSCLCSGREGLVVSESPFAQGMGHVTSFRLI
jgi:hypothetical protein